MMTYRALVLSAVSAVLILASPLEAQRGQTAEGLRAQVVERLLQSMKTQAGLSDEQFERVQMNIRSTMDGREALRRQERALWQAIEAQLRPGTAADEAELARLLDEALDLQDQGVALNRTQQAELAEFLTPVQRAVVIRSLTRLQRQVEGMVQRRMGPGRPGGRGLN